MAPLAAAAVWLLSAAVSRPLAATVVWLLSKAVSGPLAATVVWAFVGGEEGAEFLLVEAPGLWIDAVAYAGAFDSSLDEAGVLQLLEVLGDGRLGEAQFLYEVAIDAGICLYQVLDDGYAGGMRKRLHHSGKLVLFVGEYLGSRQAHIYYFIAILR